MHVYILRCSDNSYYIGVTNDLETRVIQHNQGLILGCYTSKRLPVKLLYYESYYGPEAAIKREKQLKKWSRIKKENLMNGLYGKLGETWEES